MSLTLVWLVCMGGPLLLGLWAQSKVKRTFARWSEVPVRNGMTGAQAAAEVIRASGLRDVEIRAVEGRLSDHYDPRNRTLNLSADVGQASTVAAIDRGPDSPITTSDPGMTSLAVPCLPPGFVRRASSSRIGSIPGRPG